MKFFAIFAILAVIQLSQSAKIIIHNDFVNISIVEGFLVSDAQQFLDGVEEIVENVDNATFVYAKLMDLANDTIVGFDINVTAQIGNEDFDNFVLTIQARDLIREIFGNRTIFG